MQIKAEFKKNEIQIKKSESRISRKFKEPQLIIVKSKSVLPLQYSHILQGQVFCESKIACGVFLKPLRTF